jgi:glutamate transport system substrate-binding protein
MTKTRIGLVAGAAVLALGLSACGSDSGSGDSASGDSGSGGKSIKIGTKFDQPGLGLKQGDTFTGFDIDVANYVAKELGYDQVDFIQAPSAQRESLIETGQVDLVVATYSITDSRKEKVSFAGPYFIAGQDLLVKADNSDITGPDSLDGKKLCSVTGSTSAQTPSASPPSWPAA